MTAARTLLLPSENDEGIKVMLEANEFITILDTLTEMQIELSPTIARSIATSILRHVP